VAEKRGNGTPEKENIDQKRSRSEQSSCACIIHCTDDDTELVRSKDEESWSALVRGERLLFVNTNTLILLRHSMKEKSKHLLSQKIPKRVHHGKALGNNLN